MSTAHHSPDTEHRPVPDAPDRGSSENGHMNYLRFAAMIATSTVVMFVLMYLNAFALDHVR